MFSKSIQVHRQILEDRLTRRHSFSSRIQRQDMLVCPFIIYTYILCDEFCKDVHTVSEIELCRTNNVTQLLLKRALEKHVSLKLNETSKITKRFVFIIFEYTYFYWQIETNL